MGCARAPINIKPSSHVALCSSVEVATSVVTSRVTASKVPKSSVSGAPMAHATRTSAGMTPSAICTEEPSATPSARSVLPL